MNFNIYSQWVPFGIYAENNITYNLYHQLGFEKVGRSDDDEWELGVSM
ncbi:MAG: hypothetical protein ACRDA4_07315 [Filifactoraceae bacterium]